MNEPSVDLDVPWALLTVVFAVSFSARPVVRLKVSMTFIPEALPIGFHGGVKVHLCFERRSGTTVAESGNKQPG